MLYFITIKINWIKYIDDFVVVQYKKNELKKSIVMEFRYR